MIEILEVPKEFVFNNGDIVEVTGILKSGVGKIFNSYYPTKQPKGELLYCFTYSESFPQLDVNFEDGKRIHYNGNDLLQGKIKKTDKTFNEAKKLRDWMNELIIDTTQACKDLSYLDEGTEEVKETLFEESKDIIKFISPLLDEDVFVDTHEEIFLGEFDSHTYVFKSANIGSALRNSGIPAFELFIYVDGYAPVTFELKVSEVYFW